MKRFDRDGLCNPLLHHGSFLSFEDKIQGLHYELQAMQQRSIFQTALNRLILDSQVTPLLQPTGNFIRQNIPIKKKHS